HGRYDRLVLDAERAHDGAVAVPELDRLALRGRREWLRREARAFGRHGGGPVVRDAVSRIELIGALEALGDVAQALRAVERQRIAMTAAHPAQESQLAEPVDVIAVIVGEEHGRDAARSPADHALEVA